MHTKRVSFSEEEYWDLFMSCRRRCLGKLYAPLNDWMTLLREREGIYDNTQSSRAQWLQVEGQGILIRVPELMNNCSFLIGDKIDATCLQVLQDLPVWFPRLFFAGIAPCSP